jgi:hypothetical protein
MVSSLIVFGGCINKRGLLLLESEQGAHLFGIGYMYKCRLSILQQHPLSAQFGLSSALVSLRI